MGNWTVVVEGIGQHHNSPERVGDDVVARDANIVTKDFVDRLIKEGHVVEHATFTHGARDEL